MTIYYLYMVSLAVTLHHIYMDLEKNHFKENKNCFILSAGTNIFRYVRPSIKEGFITAGEKALVCLYNGDSTDIMTPKDTKDLWQCPPTHHLMCLKHCHQFHLQENVTV